MFGLFIALLWFPNIFISLAFCSDLVHHSVGVWLDICQVGLLGIKNSLWCDQWWQLMVSQHRLTKKWNTNIMTHYNINHTQSHFLLQKNRSLKIRNLWSVFEAAAAFRSQWKFWPRALSTLQSHLKHADMQLVVQAVLNGWSSMVMRAESEATTEQCSDEEPEGRATGDEPDREEEWHPETSERETITYWRRGGLKKVLTHYLIATHPTCQISCYFVHLITEVQAQEDVTGLLLSSETAAALRSVQEVPEMEILNVRNRKQEGGRMIGFSCPDQK